MKLWLKKPLYMDGYKTVTKDAVPEILAFTFPSVMHSFLSTNRDNKNKDTNRCKIPLLTYCMLEKVVLAPANLGRKVIQ